MSTDGSSFYLLQQASSSVVVTFPVSRMSKTFSQLDIKDTKLRGIIAIHWDSSTKFWILHSTAIPFAMMSNNVANQKISRDEHSTNHIQSAPRTGSQRSNQHLLQLQLQYRLFFHDAVITASHSPLLSRSQSCRCQFCCTLLNPRNMAAHREQ